MELEALQAILMDEFTGRRWLTLEAGANTLALERNSILSRSNMQQDWWGPDQRTGLRSVCAIASPSKQTMEQKSLRESMRVRPTLPTAMIVVQIL